MLKNKKKSGEKRKTGRAKQPPVHAFDLEFINRNDLKKYVSFLEKEFSLMRKECAFYSSNKERIMEFLETRRNDLMAQNKMSVVTTAEKEEFLELMRRFPVKYNENLLLGDRERVRKKLKNLFNDFVTRSTVKVSHFEEEEVMKRQIADRNKLIEFHHFLNETAMMDMKETNQSALEHADSKHSGHMERILRQNIRRCLAANREFSSNKIRTLISVWDVQNRHQESYWSETKRMQSYFHDISSSNNEVIKMLRQKLASLSTELRKVALSLNQVAAQNRELRVVQPATFPPAASCAGTPFKVSRNIQESQNERRLKFKNEVLRQQLRIEREKFQNMKKQLVSATRKIFQNAEFKTHVLEELIKLNLQMETMTRKVKDHQPATQKHEETEGSRKVVERKYGVVNLFSIRVEDSDTLFVPPHYDKFWD